MRNKLRAFLSLLNKTVLAVLIVCGFYALFLTGLILWNFELKLKRWPTFVHAAPFVLSVGEDIGRVGLLERLQRLGYLETMTATPEPGEWLRSGSQLTIGLRHFPLSAHGVASGPVRIALRANRADSIRLAGASEGVDKPAIEPELLDIIPAKGFPKQLCRPSRLRDINPLLKDAIVLTEDPRFISHWGVDMGATYRAIKANVKAGRYVEGGSTIPQQLVRMTLLSPEKTLWRKCNEICMALIADAIYSKETILESYLNRVYFGHSGRFPIIGVAEASRVFFGKSQAELDAGRCALLAAMIRAPNVVNPYVRPERAQRRRNMILGLMLNAGKISPTEHDQAAQSPIKVVSKGSQPIRADAFLSLVDDKMDAQGTAGDLIIEGQDVVTSLDPWLHTKAQEGLNRLGKAGADAYLVMITPATGAITSYVAPSADKSSGLRGDLESLLPVTIIPALIGEKPGESGLSLNSQIFRADVPRDPITFRAALHTDPNLLTQKVISSAGRDRVIAVLKEFGVRVRLNHTGEMAFDPISPIEYAGIYSLLAGIGKSPRPQIATRPRNRTDPSSHLGMRRVSVNPAVLFLVNYVLKEPMDRPGKRRTTGPRSDLPSIFHSSDPAGLWSVAYNEDALIVVRTPEKDVDPTRIKAMMAGLLYWTRGDSRPRSEPPEGIVFKRVCSKSGLRATSLCPNVIEEAFIKGTQPVEWCPLGHESTP